MKKILIFLFVLLSLSACTTKKQDDYYNNTVDAILYYREKLINKSSFNLTYADVSDPSNAEEESFDYIIRIEFEYLKSDNSKGKKSIYVKITNNKFKQSDFSTEQQESIKTQYGLNTVVPYRLNTETVIKKLEKQSK